MKELYLGSFNFKNTIRSNLNWDNGTPFAETKETEQFYTTVHSEETLDGPFLAKVKIRKNRNEQSQFALELCFWIATK